MSLFPDSFFLRSRCRRIFINQLTLPCSIGIYETEKQHRQRLQIDCDVWVLKSNPACGSQLTDENDSIDAVLDYDCIGNILRQAALKHTNLQETLVCRLIEQIAVLPGVVLVRLSTAKLDAYADAQAVGIEEWRVGSSFTALTATHD